MHYWTFFFLFISANTFGGWKSVFEDDSGWKLPHSYPIRAYSEYMPAPKLGVRPYELRLEGSNGEVSQTKSKILGSHAFSQFYDPQHENTFWISPLEEIRDIQPGLHYLSEHWLEDLQQLIESKLHPEVRQRVPGIYQYLTHGNPYWSEDLPVHPNQAIVSFSFLTLSRTQDDMGRTPWTVYGGSEKDWEASFWSALSDRDGGEKWLLDILKKIFPRPRTAQSLSAARVKIFSRNKNLIPSQLAPFLLKEGSHDPISILITFEPFREWPVEIKNLYRSGDLQVLPHPATLIFSRPSVFDRAAQKNEEAYQLALAGEFTQFSSAVKGLRLLPVRFLSGIPSTKPLEESDGKSLENDGVTYQKQERRFSPQILWDDGGNALSVPPALVELKRATAFSMLFNSSQSADLYDKPMAKNAQIWRVSRAKPNPLTSIEWLFDGVDSGNDEITSIENQIQRQKKGFRYYYRPYYKPMEVNGFPIRWSRPLIAWLHPTKRGKDRMGFDYQLLGEMRVKQPFSVSEIKLKVALKPDAWQWQAALLRENKGVAAKTTPLNIKKIIDYRALLKERLSEDLASRLLSPDRNETPKYSNWVQRFSEQTDLNAALHEAVDISKRSSLVVPKTFPLTVGDVYEERYWEKLRYLTRNFREKNNVEPIPYEQHGHSHPSENRQENHLPKLIEYLESYYDSIRKQFGSLMTFRHAFHWEVDFNFSWWMGRRLLNDPTLDLEHIRARGHKNLVVVIPGDNRNEAVIMADHIDTAFDGTLFEKTGHRHAAPGADDNHSATVSLMEAALAIKQAEQGGLRLRRDIWLVHLTGEEFPADCLGARAITESLVVGQKITDRPNPKIVGVYVLDMVGHNTDRDQGDSRSIFQIAPGSGERSALLAKTAHEVTQTWNLLAGVDEKSGWNSQFKRKSHAHRSERGEKPASSLFPQFAGEIRPGWHFRSALYNTDGIIFSDAGVPVVLFMENYDIYRSGYHDALDDVENIDLDFAAGLSRIAIETVVQMASGD